MWNKRQGCNVFIACMSRDRFDFITQNLRFDDKDTRDERVRQDKVLPHTHGRGFLIDDYYVVIPIFTSKFASHLLALGAVLERDIVPRPPPGARRPVHNHDDMPDDAPKTRCHVCVSAQVRGQRVTSRATKQCPICRRKMCRAHAVEICCNCNELEQFDD